MTDMECKWCQDEICVNDQSPMRADYCPVPDTPDVCRYEEREKAGYVLTPKGCAIAALGLADMQITLDQFDQFWHEFLRLMIREGYVATETN